MKSILLFTFLAFFTSSLTCCRFDEREVAPIFSKDGMWQTRNIETTNYDSNNQVIARDARVFKDTEMAIEFNEAATLFKEFENGVLTRSGNYMVGSQPESLIMITPTDTLEVQVMSITSNELVLQSQKKSAVGQSVQVINYER